MTTTRFFALFTCVLLTSLIQSSTGAQFFNIICLFVSSDCLAAAPPPASLIAIVPF